MSKYIGSIVTWVDTRFNPENTDVENGTVIGEGRDKFGVDYWEVSQGGKYRAIDKQLVTAIEQPSE